LVKHRIGDSRMTIVCHSGRVFVQDSNYNDIVARVLLQTGEVIEDGLAVIGSPGPIQFLAGPLTCEVVGDDLILNTTHLRVSTGEFDTIESLNEPFAEPGKEIFLPLLTGSTFWLKDSNLPYQECLFITPHAAGCIDGFSASWVEADISVAETIAVRVELLPPLADSKVFVSSKYMWITNGALSCRMSLVEIGDALGPQQQRITPYEVILDISPPESFGLVLRRLQMLSEPSFDGGLVAMDVKPGLMILGSCPSEIGHDTVELPIDYDGQEINFAFRPGQIVKMLGNTPEPARLQIKAGRALYNEEWVDARYICVTNGEIIHVATECSTTWKNRKEQE
jgi:hypothetical protein